MPSPLVVGTNTYVTLAAADSYLEDSPSAFLLWATGDPDQKARCLISAFRAIDPLMPDTVDPLAAPQPVKDAQVVYAYELSRKPALEASTSTGSNIKAAGAGPAQVEFFRPTDGSRFPARVTELLAPYLGLGITPGSAPGSGSDGPSSQFDDCDSYGLSEGLP